MKIRVLIALAVLFGFVALATSIGIAWGYFRSRKGFMIPDDQRRWLRPR